MPEALVVVAVGVVAYAATSLDNLLLLVALLGRAGQPRLPLFAGTVAASAIVAATGLLASEISDFAPARYVGWLGVVPIALGMRELASRWRPTAPEGAGTGRPLGTLATTGIMLAQSSDALAAFVPIFADAEDPWPWLLTAVVLASSVTLCAIGGGVGRSGSLGAAIQRFGGWLAPFALIAVGAYVVLDTATDVIPGR